MEKLMRFMRISIPVATFLGSLIFLVWNWVIVEKMQQWKVLNTMIWAIATFSVILIWLLLFSGIRAKLRFLILGITAAILVPLYFLFPVRGMTGDLLPVFRFRWSQDDGSLEVVEKKSNFTELHQTNTNDYPAFLGRNRDGVVANIKIAKDWSQHPPKLLWKQSIGSGYSSFAVASNLAITQEQRGEQEMVICYELLSGKIVWTHANKDRFNSDMGPGPRATPTIHQNEVFTVGATGILNAIDMTTGKCKWTKNILQESQTQNLSWGFSSSPLIWKNLLIINPGGKNYSLVAYNKDDGSLVWSSGSTNASYSSPQTSLICGSEQILIRTENNIEAHAPQTGELLWQYYLKEQIHVAQPVVLDQNKILVSSGYGFGSRFLQIEAKEQAFSANLLWESNAMKAKFSNVIHYQGFFYGLDDGILACINAKDGKRSWKGGRYGHGQIMLAHDIIIVQAESGEIVLVEPNPKQQVEIAKIQALEGKTWNHPVLAGKYLLTRNDREAVCYELVLEN